VRHGHQCQEGRASYEIRSKKGKTTIRNNKYVRRAPEEVEAESAAATGHAVTRAVFSLSHSRDTDRAFSCVSGWQASGREKTVSREKAVSSSKSKRAGSSETVRIITSARATAVPLYYFAPVDLIPGGYQAVKEDQPHLAEGPFLTAHLPAGDVQAGDTAEGGASHGGARHVDPGRISCP
jgi:hypothetical protein